MVLKMPWKLTIKFGWRRCVISRKWFWKPKRPGANDRIDDAECIKLIQKLAKQGKESAEIYRQQGREDLYEQESGQVAVLEEFLPKQLDEAELTEALKAIIAEVGASSAKDMGKVMGTATKKLAGLADGKAISAKVKELLGWARKDRWI